MTVRELFVVYHAELARAGLRRMDGINGNATKSQLENAIECLRASDADMDLYLSALAREYPNTARTIANNGDYKKHYFNRLHVFNVGRQILRAEGRLL